MPPRRELYRLGSAIQAAKAGGQIRCGAGEVKRRAVEQDLALLGIDAAVKRHCERLLQRKGALGRVQKRQAQKRGMRGAGGIALDGQTVRGGCVRRVLAGEHAERLQRERKALIAPVQHERARRGRLHGAVDHRKRAVGIDLEQDAFLGRTVGPRDPDAALDLPQQIVRAGACVRIARAGGFVCVRSVRVKGDCVRGGRFFGLADERPLDLAGAQRVNEGVHGAINAVGRFRADGGKRGGDGQAQGDVAVRERRSGGEARGGLGGLSQRGRAREIRRFRREIVEKIVLFPVPARVQMRDGHEEVIHAVRRRRPDHLPHTGVGHGARPQREQLGHGVGRAVSADVLNLREEIIARRVEPGVDFVHARHVEAIEIVHDRAGEAIFALHAVVTHTVAGHEQVVRAAPGRYAVEIAGAEALGDQPPEAFGKRGALPTRKIGDQTGCHVLAEARAVVLLDAVIVGQLIVAAAGVGEARLVGEYAPNHRAEQFAEPAGIALVRQGDEAVDRRGIEHIDGELLVGMPDVLLRGAQHAHAFAVPDEAAGHEFGMIERDLAFAGAGRPVELVVEPYGHAALLCKINAGGAETAPFLRHIGHVAARAGIEHDLADAALVKALEPRPELIARRPACDREHGNERIHETIPPCHKRFQAA